jgi:serine/threonine protein kinase/tetratricopeptide (TPR) repeat protein
MPLASGSRLGPYEIIASLGKGGMGEVYRAKDARLGRDVAIKVLPADVAADPDRLARFEREAKSVASLNHPNIVVLHSIEEAEGVRFLTMELVEGEPLDRLVTAGGMPLVRLLDLAIPLADALSAAHQKGVVHRDLKPANVMLSKDGRIKVLDFGLAKLTSDEFAPGATQAPTMESPISSVGQVVGTVPYMSPEQLRGDPTDARTDLFALGVVLYELATGKRPFGGASAVEISSAILRDPPPPPRSVRADLPPDLDRIIGRCLAKDPERRVQTAKDVRNELELVRRIVGPGGAPPVRRERRETPKPKSDAPSIAVLPFANRSAGAEDEYFSDGLADELISVLVKIRGLRVAARTSSGTFKGKQVTIAEVGQALGVATVLEGSVRKAGNRVRISVQLVKVEDGYPLWSETYDRTLEDIFAVQDDIAQSVVKELRTTLLGEAADSDASGDAKADVAAAAVGRGENPEAHRLYLQGTYFLDRLTEGDTAKGIGYLKEAVALDPAHALAWVEIARGLSTQAAYGWLTVHEGYARAREAVQHALALAPNLPEAHLRRSQIQSFYEWDWKAARESCKRALELAPGSVSAYSVAGTLEHYLGHFDEAERLLRRAVEQDPLSSRGYSALGYLYRSQDRFAEAEQAYRKSLELSPNRITAHHLLAWIYAEQGRKDEALREAELEPTEWGRLTALAHVHHCFGNKAESDAALARLIADHAADSAFQIAAIHGVRGETDAAFEWLERAYAQHDSGLSLAYIEPSFRSLHGDPRWQALVDKVGFERS